MSSKKKLKRKNKRLEKELQEEKRQRKYAERDAKMWCDIVLEQDNALETKDIVMADYMAEIEELKAPKIQAWLNGDPVEFKVNTSQ